MPPRDAALTLLVLWGLAVLPACREPGDVDPDTDIPDVPAPEVPAPDAPAFQTRFRGALPTAADAQLAGHEAHEYDLGEMTAGAAVHVVLEQRGIDLVALIVDEDGDSVLRLDGPTGQHGFEHVCFVAPAAGSYRLRVGPWSAADAGPYGLAVRERADAPSDARIGQCQEANEVLMEAVARHAEASAEVAALYERAADLWRRIGEPFPLAVALKQAGMLAFRRGELEAALHSYGGALELLRAPAGDSDPRQLASVLNLAGLAHDRRGEPERAWASFEEARRVSQELGDRFGEAVAISNLALWETSGSDLHHAVELHRRALDVWRDLGLEHEEATTLNVLGVSLTQLGRYDEALDVLREALAIRQEDPPLDLAHTRVAIGWVEHLAGRGDNAVDHFLRAAELYDQAGAPLEEAGARDRLGSAYRQLGRHEDARTAFEHSLTVYRASADRVHTAHTASNLGCLLGDADLLAEAGETFARLDDRAALAHVHFCQARAERDAGRLDTALVRIEESAALVDELRTAALERGYYAPALDLWQDYSDLHVDVLMRLHERDPRAGHDVRAFEISDLMRARHLYEILLAARVQVRSGVPDELLERERRIRRRLNTAEERRRWLRERQAVSAADDDDKVLRDLLRELAEVRAAIRAASPRFAELRQPSPVRLAQVRELLDADTLLLSYVLGDERGYLFVVSRDGLESHPLPGRQHLDELAWRVYEGLRHSWQRRVRRQLPALAGRLGEVLLGPIADQLAGRRLLVVGDGMLHYVPFAALPLTAVAESELVVDRYEVVHLPSAAVARLLSERSAERTQAPLRIAVVADAVYSPRDERLPTSARTRSPPVVEPLPDLPYTEREAVAILDLVAPEQRLAVLGFAAGPELVRGGALRDYRILHFATHGLLHEAHPELSGLALSMFDEAGRPRDGHLRLHEIYALELPADLVVLSACRTALTREAQGAGLVGLTHGFFYAGASRLVVSLWDVHDEATSELMVAFYRALLRDGLTPPAALREAQQRLRSQERWSAPYYWAGFVLEGDWE